MASPAPSPAIHPNLKLLSHSSCVTLHKCPRKFELYRLKQPDASAQEGSIDLDFGHWVGEGIQRYMVTGSLDAAYMATFLACKGGILDEAGARSSKTFFDALVAIDRFAQLWETAFRDYELVILPSGKPAVELGFILNCFDGFSYRGFLDALLINKLTRTLAVMESKTTKFRNVHSAVYKNSGQGLGYSLITDSIAEAFTLADNPVSSAWQVFYPVWKTSAAEWEVFQFAKSNRQRASWIRGLLRDISHIAEYAEDEAFPMHGESCFDFFRPCEYFDICELSNEFLLGEPDLIPVRVEDNSKYPFTFDLTQVINTQRAKLATQEDTE